MILTEKDVAKMMDLSCVKTFSTLGDVHELLESAKKYGFGQVSVLQCYLPYCKESLAGRSDINIVGNVGFPSGSDNTECKLFQTQQMLDFECDEMDITMNVGMLLSGEYAYVQDEIAKTVQLINKKIPLKVIIEVAYLSDEMIVKASEICMNADADFVKTGTGWSAATTVDQVKLIKSVVGDKLRIKASGGVRTADDFAAMVKAGANRIGINLKSGISIVEEVAKRNGLEV